MIKIKTFVCNMLQENCYVMSDDLAVLLYVLKKVWTDVDPDIKEKAREKLSKWFDDDEIGEIDTLFD